MKRLSRFTMSISVLVILFSLFFGVQSVSAAVKIDPKYVPGNVPTFDNYSDDDTGDRGYGTDAIVAYVGKIISFFLLLAGVLAVHYIINNAFFLMAASGSSEMIEQYKKGLFWAVLGLVLVLLSYIIMRFLTQFIINTVEEGDPAAVPVDGSTSGGAAPSGAVIYEIAEIPSLENWSVS